MRVKNAQHWSQLRKAFIPLHPNHNRFVNELFGKRIKETFGAFPLISGHFGISSRLSRHLPSAKDVVFRIPAALNLKSRHVAPWSDLGGRSQSSSLAADMIGNATASAHPPPPPPGFLAKRDAACPHSSVRALALASPGGERVRRSPTRPKECALITHTHGRRRGSARRRPGRDRFCANVNGAHRRFVCFGDVGPRLLGRPAGTNASAPRREADGRKQEMHWKGSLPHRKWPRARTHARAQKSS